MRLKQLEWTAVTYGAGALATVVTRRALTAAWQGAQHGPPPDDPADRNTPWSTALVWAIATGVGLGVVRLLALRSAAFVWEAATNEPPPP